MKRYAVLFVTTVLLISVFPAVGLAQGPIHVGDLDASSATAARNRWNATVTVTVHDELEAPVQGATVTGSWSGVKGKKNTSPAGSCTTDGNGRCSITLNGIKNRTEAVTFTVDGVSSATDMYETGSNHDPDGDGDGTTVTVLRP